jgi:hypothetical protein
VPHFHPVSLGQLEKFDQFWNQQVPRMPKHPKRWQFGQNLCPREVAEATGRSNRKKLKIGHVEVAVLKNPFPGPRELIGQAHGLDPDESFAKTALT